MGTTHGHMGMDCTVQIGDDAVGHFRNLAPELTAEEINTTSADTDGWRTRKAGLKDGSYELGALWIPDDTARQAIEDAFHAGTEVDLLWTDADGNGWTHQCMISRLSVGNIEYDASEGMEFLATLLGDGAPVLAGYSTS